MIQGTTALKTRELRGWLASPTPENVQAATEEMKGTVESVRRNVFNGEIIQVLASAQGQAPKTEHSSVAQVKQDKNNYISQAKEDKSQKLEPIIDKTSHASVKSAPPEKHAPAKNQPKGGNKIEELASQEKKNSTAFSSGRPIFGAGAFTGFKSRGENTFQSRFNPKTSGQTHAESVRSQQNSPRGRELD